MTFAYQGVTVSEESITGDINGDQAIDLKDVIDGLRLVSNLNPKNICVDGDGKIGLADSVYALRVAAQLIDSGLPH